MKLKDAKYFGIKLSPHRIKNDKGQLIVTGCEFARTGKQKYHSSELGLKDDKFIYLDRPVEEVSDSKTVASFEGAPVTLDHPEDDVKVGVNYDTLAKGFATNVKYIADSDKEGHLQADFIFTDADLIKRIENNEINELSAGYNCDVDEKDWVQRHIRGNHIAVVAQARAGHQARLLDKKYKSTSKSQKTLKIGDKLVNIKDSYSYEIEDENGIRCRYTDYYTETESGKKKFLCTLKDSTDKTVKYAVPKSSFKEVEKLTKDCKFKIKNKEEVDGYTQFEVVGDAEAEDCWKDLDAKVKDINSHKNVVVTKDSVNPKNVILVKVNNKWKTYGGSNAKTFEEDSRYDYITNKYGLANTKFVPNENLDQAKLQDSEDKTYVTTPRGTFTIVNKTEEELRKEGYGYHHSSNDDKYKIFTKNNKAVAIKNVKAQDCDLFKDSDDEDDEYDDNFVVKRTNIDNELKEIFYDSCFNVQGFTNGNESTEGSIYVVDINPWLDEGCYRYVEDNYEVDFDEEYLELACEYFEDIIRSRIGNKDYVESIDVDVTDWSGEEEFPVDAHIYCRGVTK